MTPVITATTNTHAGNANANAEDNDDARSTIAMRTSPVGHVSDEDDTDEAAERDDEHDKDIHTMGNEDVGEGSEKRVACLSGCTKTFDTEYEMKRHRANAHPYKFRRYTCSLCGFQVLQWRQNMHRHIRNVHKDVDLHSSLCFTEDFKLNLNRDLIPLAIHSTIFNSTPAGGEKDDDAAKATRLRCEAARARCVTTTRRRGLEWVRRQGIEPTPADQHRSSSTALVSALASAGEWVRHQGIEPTPAPADQPRSSFAIEFDVQAGDDGGTALVSALTNAGEDDNDAVGSAVGDEDDSPLDLSSQKH